MGNLVYGINDDNFYECIEISKEIFWMYYDIVITNCIVHGVDYEKIDFERYMMCEIIEDRLKTPREESIVKLVREGCFTALCCHVLIIMEEKLKHNETLELIENMLNEEKIQTMLFEKESLIIMKDMLIKKQTCSIHEDKYWTEFSEGQVFLRVLDEVYKKFVVGYYQAMLEQK